MGHTKHTPWLTTVLATVMTVAGSVFAFFASAQIPQDIPHPDNTEPVDFSHRSNIIFYIGVPLLMLIGYFILRKWRARKRAERGY